MKRKYYNILLVFLVIYMIVYRTIIYTKFLKFNECITSVFCILLLTFSFLLIGYRKTINNEISRRINKIVLYRLLLFFSILFAFGIFIGFLKNSYSLELPEIINNSIFLLLIYVCIEVFRYNYISYDKNNKKGIVIMTIILILFDTNLQIRFNTFDNIDNIFEFITNTFLPIVLNNVLLSNIIYITNNYKSNIIYTLVMKLYIFIVPLVPDINEFIRSILLLILPFSLLLSISRISFVKEELKPKKNYKFDIVIIVVLLFLISLVFGIGPFKMVGIETASMSPNFNVGDAVIINKYINKDELKEDDVIAYYDKDNRLIVHRIIKINSDKTFITKGDMNNTADSKYVNKDQIFGKVIFRIPYIAYPAVKLRER